MTGFTTVFGNNTVYPAEISYRAFSISADTALVWPTEIATSTNIATALMEVTATAISLNLKLPDATLTAGGAAVLVYNGGANPFTVADASGSPIVTITSGQAWQLWLRDNTTTAGSWRAIQFGAGTSIATASSLAGPGLQSIGAQLQQVVSVLTTSTSPFAIGTASLSNAIVWTGSAGTFTLATATTLGASWFCHVKNAGSGVLNVTPTAPNLIDGLSTIALQPGDSFIVLCDGSAFYTVGKGQTATYSFTYLAINVAGTGDYALSTTEASKTAIKLTGLLTGNRTISLPATVQQVWVNNATTGSFSLTVQVTGAPGATVTVPQNGSMVLYSDGTNIINAASAGISTPISIANGGTGSTTASAALTALGGTSTGVAVFTATSQAAAMTALGAAPLASPAFTGNGSIAGIFSAGALNVTSTSVPANGAYLPATNSVGITTNSTLRLLIDATGSALFSGVVTTRGNLVVDPNNSVRSAQLTTDAGVELFSTAGGYIDFKLTAGADYDVRVQHSTPNGLTITAVSGLVMAGATGGLLGDGIINAKGLAINGTAISIASAADLRAATASKYLTTDSVWNAGALVTLTPAATITPDFGAGFNFTLTANQNFTLANPTNAKASQSGFILVTQDGTGSRTITFGANWKKPTAGISVLSTAAGAVDLIAYTVVSPTLIIYNLLRGIA